MDNNLSVLIQAYKRPAKDEHETELREKHAQAFIRLDIIERTYKQAQQELVQIEDDYATWLQS